MDRVRSFLRLPPLESGIDGSGVVVAVLDTGIDQDHADLSDCISSESRSLAPLDSRLIDEVGHGTHVAGIIAGSGTASGGRFRGVAPGSKLLVLRVSTTDKAYSDTVARAVLFAVDRGADVINYSAGSSAGSMPPPWVWPVRRTALEQALAYATNQGVLCIAAAGNDGPLAATVSPPGIRRDVLCVGAIGRDGRVAEGSARGPVYLDPSLRKGGQTRYDELLPGTARPAPFVKPDIVAPGGGFPSAWGPLHAYRRNLGGLGLYDDGVVSCRSSLGKTPGLPEDRRGSPYTSWPGTSMATAVVSGLASLAIQYAWSLGLQLGDDRAKALQNIMCKAAQPLAAGTADDFGHGAVIWPSIASLIEDCVDNPDQREAVLHGPQLEVVSEEDHSSSG